LLQHPLIVETISFSSSDLPARHCFRVGHCDRTSPAWPTLTPVSHTVNFKTRSVKGEKGVKKEGKPRDIGISSAPPCSLYSRCARMLTPCRHLSGGYFILYLSFIPSRSLAMRGMERMWVGVGRVYHNDRVGQGSGLDTRQLPCVGFPKQRQVHPSLQKVTPKSKAKQGDTTRKSKPSRKKKAKIRKEQDWGQKLTSSFVLTTASKINFSTAAFLTKSVYGCA
jgi:hypothetical protein